MDYEAVHGQDVSNFHTPLTHRVVTVSAAEADAALQTPSSTASDPAPALTRFVSTGIATLDAVLAGVTPPDDANVGDNDAGAGGGTATAQCGSRPGQGQGQDQGQDQSQNPIPCRASGFDMDTTLSPTTLKASRRSRPCGGVRRGLLTEIWGPPGVGKTAFGMQLVASTLRDGGTAVWIDCFEPLCGDRLADVVLGHGAHDTDDADGHAARLQDGFAHYVCPSLPHFITMLCPPPPAQPPCVSSDATALVVVDGLSALVNYALPRTAEGMGARLMANGKKGPAPHEKRTQVLQYMTAALERLAETRNVAVVVLTQCASRVQAERGAALAPALHAFVWDRGVSTRLVLFRDWASKDGHPIGGRFVGVQKLDGRETDAGIGQVIAFDVTQSGLVEEHYAPLAPRSSIYKRRFDDTELGDRTVEDDDYGWDDDDDSSLPRMPPQWQGSEDILLGHRYEEGEEEEEEEDADQDGDEATERGADRNNSGRESGFTAAVVGDSESDVDAEPLVQLPRARRSSHSVADSEEDSDL